MYRAVVVAVRPFAMMQSPAPLVQLPSSSRSLLGSAMRLALHTVTSISAGPTAATLATRRFPGTRAEPVAVPVGDTATPGTLFSPAGVDRFPCVLLLHGTSACIPLAYLFFIEALLERGVGVLCVDLDGHGRHPLPLSGEGLARTGTAALHWLTQHPSVIADRVAVLGVSLGGSCALRAAAHTGHARALGLVSTPFSLSMGRRRRVREFLSTLNPEALESAFRIPPHALLRSLRSQIRIDPRPDFDTIDLFHHWTEAVVQAAIDTLDPLSCATQLGDTPVVFLNGTWDTIAPPSQAEQMAACFSGPVEQIVLPRRNHFTVMTSRRGAGGVADWLVQHLG